MMTFIDLDELENVPGLWAQRGPAWARLRREDHLGLATTPLGEAVRDLVERTLNWRPQGAIRLLTNLRQFGFTMNPLSLFYCYHDDGCTLQACVAEVTNTPWGERHHYVLDFRNQAGHPVLLAEHHKELHVSPFFDMRMRYHWKVRPPGERLLVDLRNLRGGELLFNALLQLRRVPLTAGQRWRMLLAYPAQPLKIFAGIYWQALRLWWKGVPYVPHPAPKSTT